MRHFWKGSSSWVGRRGVMCRSRCATPKAMNLHYESMQRNSKPMPSHKFKVGDIVTLKRGINVFEVVKQLPGSSEAEYRIKSANEPHERMARESELSKA
jgi:hypothetical protein